MNRRLALVEQAETARFDALTGIGEWRKRALAAEKLLTKKQKPCHWRADDEGNYDTDCGHKHCFFAGGPTENDHRFCPYCGRALVDVPYKPKRFRTGVRGTQAGEAGAEGGGGTT